MMPTMTGYEVLKYLRERGRLETIPVIVCSASHDRFVPPPGVHLLNKPFEIDALLSLVYQAGEPQVTHTASP
jgi:CheY-like chemotaxis protein